MGTEEGRKMPMSSENVQRLLGYSSPPREPERLLSYAEKLIAEKGEDFLRQNATRLRDEWEYILSL
jgi:hypothetical protein